TGGGIKRNPIGNVFKVKTIYSGNNALLRLFAGLWDGYFLIKKAKKVANGPIIVLTSPPLLPFWASWMLKNREWVLWSMDLFPEGYAAIGTIKEDNPIYKYLIKYTYKYPPSKLIALGAGQKKILEKKYAQQINGVILPCGVFNENQETTEFPKWKSESDKIYFGYLGNCGMPHSPNFVKAAIDAIDPRFHRMILVVYGIHADEVKKHAAGKEGIILLDNVPRQQLKFVDVHLVTLLPKWTHVAVPSKAVSSVCSGAAIIFCGNAESDNYQLLKEAAWQINDDENLGSNLKKLMRNINLEQLHIKRSNAKIISSQLADLIKDSYDEIAQWVE
ncbi:MAG: hypothetical protein RLZZ546_893, partial [Bacteroidota bacterium]